MKKTLSLMLCVVLMVGITGCGNENDKLVKYLEKQSFKCENGIDESENYGKTCTKGNKQNQEIFEISDGGITYEVRRGSYHYTIQDSMYVEGSKYSQKSIIMTDDDELTCRYSPDGGGYSYGVEVDTTSTNDICISYIDKINESLRDFEDYFEDADIELGK